MKIVIHLRPDFKNKDDFASHFVYSIRRTTNKNIWKCIENTYFPKTKTFEKSSSDILEFIIKEIAESLD